MELVIAEKPSVARDIARVLKCTKKGNGFLYNDSYVVSWAVGHLVTLFDPEDYDQNLKRWTKESLPIIPEEIKIKAIKQTESQLKVIEKIMKRDSITSLICATDSGREGELIFRYIYELLKCKKPFKRLWISSMTDAAIKEGFSKLKDGSEYDRLYNSAKCRSEADWLVGINASRAFTLKYDALLSIGRVQTPTLALIVQRQAEIDSFDARDYWEIEAEFDGWKGTWFDRKTNETKLFEKEKADEIAKKVKNKDAVVESVEKEEKKTPPPLLYDLTELQRDCNKKFSMSAQTTLSIVQALYEKRKMVTYPRTDSRYLSDDMIPRLKKIASKLQQAEEYKAYADYVVGLEKLPITKRIVDNNKINDHHAIIPTEANPNVNALSDEEKKVYNLIARRFLQVFFPYYVYSTTKIVTVCQDEAFVTRGTTVISKGWTELNPVSEKERKDENVLLPDVSKGDETNVKAVKVSKKKTKPPQAYNEASLLSAMENAGRFVDDEELKEQLKDSGLGTPATRAAIIERLIKVGYITRKGKSLIPTEKGKKLIAVVPPELKSPETTGKWEKGLTRIAKGSMEPERFMDSIKRYVVYIVDTSVKTGASVVFKADGKRGKPSKNSLGKCPACGGDVLENSKSFYCARWRNGCKFSLWKSSFEDYGVHITPEQIKELLKTKKLEKLDIVMPQTREKAKGDIAFRSDGTGIDFINVNRQ